MLKGNYFIKYFVDAAAYRLYVYMLLSVVAGRLVGRYTDLPATDTTYTHTARYAAASPKLLRK